MVENESQDIREKFFRARRPGTVCERFAVTYCNRLVVGYNEGVGCEFTFSPNFMIR